MDFVKSDTFRRMVGALLGVAIPIVNKKWGLNLSENEVLGILMLIVGWVVQSGLKSGAQIKADAQIEAAKVNSMTAADRALGVVTK